MATRVVCRSIFLTLFYSVLFLEALGQDGFLYNQYGGVRSSDFKFPVLLRDRREAQAEVTTTTTSSSSVTVSQSAVNSTEKGLNFSEVIESGEKLVNSINLNQIYKYTEKPTTPVKTTATESTSTTVVPVSTEPTTPVKYTATESSLTTVVPVSTESTTPVKNSTTKSSSTTVDPVSTESTTPVKTTATESSSTTVVPVFTEPTTPVKTTATESSSTTVVPASSEPTTPEPETNSSGDCDDVDIHSSSITTNDTMIYTHHLYYKSFFYSGEEVIDNFWVDLDSLPPNMTKESDLLSNGYRKALMLKLSFLFPFYGHSIDIITIVTGGFISTGDNSHKYLSATQYIAPLMANFDNRDSPDSRIRYADNCTALTVEWENMRLQKAENISSSMTDSPFTFQITIHASGDIVFAYKDVPLKVDRIDDTEHPVRVGLSDAYKIKKTISNINYQAFYEYRRISKMQQGKISNTTAVVFKPQPTCLSFSDCESCVQSHTSFQCRWCGEVGRCSDGLDRMRQEWLQSRCNYLSTEPQPEQVIKDNIWYQQDGAWIYAVKEKMMRKLTRFKKTE